MIPRLFACLAFFAAATGLTASTDEEQLLDLSYQLDTAVARQDLASLTALLSEHYVYTEPDATKRADNEPLAARAEYRLSRDQAWCDIPPAIRITGDTAVVTGMYRVLDSGGTPQPSPTGWFTSTWVRSNGSWQLLAEHRSRNLTTTVTSVPSASPPGIPPPPEVVAKAKPAELPATGKMAAANPVAPNKPVAPATKVATREESRAIHGAVPVSATNLFRAYEPNSVGYTYDDDDDPFLDFTFSAMFPLLPNQPYPSREREVVETRFFRDRDVHYGRPYLYFAATMRASQYIETRPSSPVVAKRFNPLISARFWARKPDGSPESEDNFFEIYYAHESNGQFISSEERFRQQMQVYYDQEEEDISNPDDAATALRTAYRSARDNISRGWDYVGVQFARDWDSTVPDNFWLPWLQDRAITMGVRAKFNYFLEQGLLQGDAEEYNEWENDPEGKPRNQVDGISLRYTLVIAPPDGAPPSAAGPKWKRPVRFERRYAFTWTTGYVQPFRYNTIKAEGSVLLFETLPLTLWGRYGYNSDLVDYYRKDYSVGVSLTFWDY